MQGISQKTIEAALPDTLRPDPRILRLDRKQPEGGISFERYKNNLIAERRISDGLNKKHAWRTLLREVSVKYGVPEQYIVALWGIETNFGRLTGGFEVIPALVTLAYDGRRGDFFRAELIKALRIVDEGHVPLHRMKGSWAGAMGQCQFMPTSFELYAQDYNGDGRRDIWTTEADVFASIAQYLAGSGWHKDEPWAERIALSKNFDNNLLGLEVQKPAEFWSKRGVVVPAAFAREKALSVVQPGGAGYKAYIVGDNYRILMKWNRSTYFATAAGLLADTLK